MPLLTLFRSDFEMFKYPAGELQVRCKSITHNSDRVLLYTTSRDIVEIGLCISAIQARKRPQQRVSLCLPYLPFSRADRRFVPGDCHGLDMFASYLSTLGIHHVYTVDVHSRFAKQFIPNLVNLSPVSLVDAAQKQFSTKVKESVNILVPDAGAKERYRGVPLQASKIRDPATGKLSGFETPSKEELGGQPTLIIDDICDGGGTFVGLAEQLKAKGVSRLGLYVTHGIFSNGLTKLLQFFDHVYTTDSCNVYDRDYQAYSNCVTVFSMRDFCLKKIEKGEYE